MFSILDSIFYPIFGRFWLPTSTPESQLNVSRLAWSLFSTFKVDIDVWSHFGTNLDQFGIQHAPKSTQKSIPRGIEKMIDFGMDFLAIFAPFWNPSWKHFGSIFGPDGRGAKCTPSTVLFCWRFSLIFSPSWPHLGPILVSFWLYFGTFGPHLGSILGSCLAPC